MTKNNGFVDLEFAKIDTNRKERNGYPEVIYGEGKTAQQIIDIARVLINEHEIVLVTRVDADKARTVREVLPTLHYNETARTLRTDVEQIPVGDIAIVTAGTSDMPVAEEARETALAMGNYVTRVYDVGVAGIHRLFARLDEIKMAKVVIVIAGMEGALASVVGGLVDAPVIAVPTSIGYGTNFGGVTPLLAMLNSCASGVTVVNIDNGFGAAYSASIMNHMGEEHE